MRKNRLLQLLSTLLIMNVMTLNAANVLNINGVDQLVDTIVPKHQVGPGTTYAFYHCPDRPLTIHVLEIDLTNPYVQMEVCDGGQKSVAVETPSSMYARNDAPGHDMIAAHNGDFYHTSSTDGTASGMSRMGLISNGECILNPVGTPMFVLTDDRVAYTESLNFNATLSTETSSTRIHTLNSHALEFDASDDSERMILYTHAYGTKTNATTGGTKVIIAPKNGEFDFADNTTISCIVESVADNAGATEIPAGKAVLYGTGANSTFLQALTAGQECTITISNVMPAQPSIKNIKEALGGSGHFIIQGGEVVISGNPDIHPRTFMGISQDRTKVYSVVVDGRWAGSAGVTLDDEGRILKWLGAWDGINLDGGGSSGMVVNAEYKNHPSDGSERAVGNGMLVFSTAPVDDNIAQIALEPRSYNIPVTARFRPAVYAYNQYGLLKTKDLEGVTLTCDPQIGVINENNEFVASQEVASGYITASYNGIEVKQFVTTIQSPLVLDYSAYMVDDRKGYPIKMSSTIGNFTYPVDAASVDWVVADANICEVIDGNVIGKQNGTTTLTGTSVNFSGVVTITVEIPEAETLALDSAFSADTWTVKQTGGKGITMSAYEDGFKFSYTGTGSGRSSYIQATKTLTTYGLPDGFTLKINPGSAVITDIQISMTDALNNRLSLDYNVEEVLEQNKMNVLNMQLSDFFENINNAYFPLTLKYLKFTMALPEKDVVNEILVPTFEQYYGEPSGVETIVSKTADLCIYPNPVDAGTSVNIEVSDDAVVCIYAMSGALMSQMEVQAGSAEISTAGFAPGLYIIRVVTENTTSVAKLIVK